MSPPECTKGGSCCNGQQQASWLGVALHMCGGDFPQVLRPPPNHTIQVNTMRSPSLLWPSRPRALPCGRQQQQQVVYQQVPQQAGRR